MLTISTLGKFRVLRGENHFDEASLRSVMLLRLFIYLILYRGKELTSEDLAQVLWQEEEVDNPVGALKNLMYRLRKCLNEFLGEDDYIITNKSAYMWNPKIDVNLDIEIFEAMINDAKAQTDEEKAVAIYERALALYQGEFMSKIKDMHWVSNRNTYYQSLYLTAVKSLAKIYIDIEAYEELEKICNEALKYENTDEQIYYYQMEARMHSGKTALALETYEEAKEIIGKELGVRKTTLLAKAYEELLRMGSDRAAYDIKEIETDILEDDPKGVYTCGYQVFKEICNLEARKNLRSKEEAQLVLFTVETAQQEALEIMDYRIKRGMDLLHNVIKHSLRVGDVASQYSECQYVVLLPSCTEELAHLVANRLVTKFFDQDSKYDLLKLKISITTLAVGVKLPS